MPRLQPTKPKIEVSSVSWSASEARILQRLSEDASDVVGRRVSSSAVLRAAVRWLGERGTGFSREHLIPLIEHEMALLRWGRKKES